MGDDDLVAKRIIRDNGGPGLISYDSNGDLSGTSPGGTSSGDDSGGGCFIDTAR